MPMKSSGVADASVVDSAAAAAAVLPRLAVFVPAADAMEAAVRVAAAVDVVAVRPDFEITERVDEEVGCSSLFFFIGLSPVAVCPVSFCCWS